MPYDKSAYVRGRRRGGGQRRDDFDRPHTDCPRHRDDDGYHERPRRRRYDDRERDRPWGTRHESRNQGSSGRWQGNRTRQSPQHTGRTSGSPVRSSVPEYSSQVPQPPQQPRTTSTTEDEQVVSILVQMYPMLRPDQVRECVFMSHNRREPFDQPLLLERCLRDIRNLFPRNPGDEFESQTQSSSSVATSYTTASFVVPRVSHLSPPARTSTVTRATITPSSSQMVSQPVKPTTASSAKSVYGVTEEEAELRRTTRPAQTRAVSPPRRQEHHKKDQYAWQPVRSKKRSNRWKQAQKHQQYSKPSSKQSHKHEKDSNKSNVQKDEVKKAQKRPNPSETPKPAPKRKRRPQCPIKTCREEQSHMRRHVIQAHLPAGFAGTDMDLAQRMASLEQFLQVARDQLKCRDNGELMNKVLKDHIYPDTRGMTIHESEEDRKMMQDFHQWRHPESVGKTPNIDPPNVIESLLHWRIAACLINVIGEEHFEVTRPTLQVSIQTEQASETTTTDVVEEPEKTSKVCRKVTQKEDSSTKEAEKVIVVPDDDTLLASIDESLATTSTKEAGPSSVAGEEPMDTDEIVSKSSAKPTSSSTKSPTRPSKNDIAASDVAPISTKPSSEPSQKTSDTGASTGQGKEMDFKAVLLRAREISTEMNLNQNRIGVAYDEKEADHRADKLAYLRSHQKISFVDTNFHMDRLQRKTGLDRLDPIMIRGPMPHIPSQLEAAVAVFCDEVPTWDKLRMLKRDHRLSFAFGVHPKHVKYVNQHPVGAIKDKILKEARCVAIGEIGIERTSRHSTLIEYQTKLLEDILSFYVESKLWSKVLVIHCRDYNNSPDASDLCLKTMENRLRGCDLKRCKIHRHCFNGPVKEMEKWHQSFPSIMFGFTALIVRPERHREVSDVIRKLPLERILLETDAPHLTAPEHAICDFNTSYGILCVAERIADLKGLQVEHVIKTTSDNARRFYNLSH